MPKDVNEVIDRLGREWEEFKKEQTLHDEQVKKTGDALSDTKEKVERLEKAVQDAYDLKDRLEKLELDKDTPRLDKSGNEYSRDQMEHAEAFLKWIRSPKDGRVQQELYEKASQVAGGTPSAGGHAIPEMISRDIEQFVIETSPMRGLVKTVTVGTNDYKELIDLRGTTSGWVGEGGSRSQTDTPDLRQVAPTFGTLYAYAQAYEEALNDIFFDVRGWLVNSIGTEFARAEGAAIIDGDGSNKPTGLLDTAPASTGDDASPARDAAAFQYFPTGDSAGFGTLSTSSPEHYPGDVFIDVIAGIKNPYRMGAVWVMNRATAGVVMKFKDADGNYLWQPGLQAGQPNMLRGFPITEMEDMPDVGTNAHPVLFGDFRRAYVLADLVGMRTTVDDNITAPGTIKFYIRRRMGGIVLNNEALKAVKCATS